MARLKNISGNAVSLFAMPGEANAYHVDADAIVEVPGECTNADDEAADAYVIGEGDAARMWSKAAWKLTKADEPPSEPAPRAGRRTTSGGNAGNGDN